MTTRMNTSCQHALFMLRWLGRTPESFMPGLTVNTEAYKLRACGAGLETSLESWAASQGNGRQTTGGAEVMAKTLRASCTAPHQLMDVRTASYAT